MWQIKSKSGVVRAKVESIEYSGEWMGSCYVTVTVKSPTPINFQIGDYIEYRDERFELNYKPTVSKTAASTYAPTAFQYKNIKFTSLIDELTRCSFLDYVLEDNNIHFTGLPKFDFYAPTVKSLADRIQANLNRIYTGDKAWTVNVYPEYADKTDVTVSVDTKNVWEALQIAVDDFEAYFTVKGRVITIGLAGVPANHVFKYGKSNGLKELECSADTDQDVITRVRVYGSTTNIPHRYYNSLTKADGTTIVPDNMAVQYLMLPDFPDKTLDPYIDSDNISELGVREGTIFFDGTNEKDGLIDIHPSLEEMTAEDVKAAGVEIYSEGRLDELFGAEAITDNGVGTIKDNENVPDTEVFCVYIKDNGFDIRDQWTGEEAQISFKSGMLGGREFTIIQDGTHRPKKDAYDTNHGYWKIWANRVYDDSLQLWFPNSAYNAAEGDRFVITGINMPDVYIKAASQRLLRYGKEWLAKNDYARSTYTPKVDATYMAYQHDTAMASNGAIASLHDTLKEGMQMLFEDSDIGVDGAITIDKLVIKEGENDIPSYEITLKEKKSVGSLTKIQNKIDSLASGLGQGTGGYNAQQIRALIQSYGELLFLSKVANDRSAGKIASDVGLEVGNYVSSTSGAIIQQLDDGTTYAELDKIYVRMKAFFETLTIVRTESLSGEKIISPAGGITCNKVEEIDGGWRCYFLNEQDGEKIDNMFATNDLARCQYFNASSGSGNGISNKFYWRLVTGVGENYIDLSKSECATGSDIPEEGDIICQLGALYDSTRQSAIRISTVLGDVPCIIMYNEINSFSLTGKDKITLGVDASTHIPYLNCYGNFTYGDRLKEGSYMSYNSSTGELEYKGKINVLSTYNGKALSTYISDTATTKASEVEERVQADIEALQRQVDGVIETWSFAYTPTAENYPASEWTDEASKQAHVGDVFYNVAPLYNDDGSTNEDSGKAWRWSQADEEHTGYHWHQISDSDAVKALELAQMSITETDIYFTQVVSGVTPALPTVGTNGTVTNYNGWETKAPTWRSGYEIWQTTKTVYGNGKVKFATAINISGKDGDSVTVVSSTVMYCASASGTETPDIGWQTEVPPMLAGQYLWTRTTVTYSDGNSTVSYSVSRSGNDGDVGSSYTNNYLINSNFYTGDLSDWSKWNTPTTKEVVELDGKKWLHLVTNAANQGVSQKNLAIDTNTQAHTLSALVRAATDTTYISIMAVVMDSDGNEAKYHTARVKVGTTPQRISVIIPANDVCHHINVYVGMPSSTSPDMDAYYTEIKLEAGENTNTQWSPAASEMLGVKVTSTTVTYAFSATSSQPADSAFKYTSTDDVPIVDGGYLWSKTVVTYSDGKTSCSYAVSRIGLDGNGIAKIVEEYYLSESQTELIGGEWLTEDNKPTWKAGYYMWTRSHVYYTNNTDAVFGEVCATGATGESAYSIDLDNEVAGLACNANGVVTGALPTITATVYKGAQADSGWSFTVGVRSGCTVSKTATNAFALSSATANTGYFTIVATKGDVSLTATFNFYKVIPGAAGESAVVYSVEPTVNNISKSYVGEYSTKTITATKYKTTGSSVREATTEKALFVQLVGSEDTAKLISGVGSTASSTITIADDTTAILLTLRESDDESSAVLDRERIPVISDATDIYVGGVNMLRNTSFGEGKRFWSFNRTAKINYSVTKDSHPSVKIANAGFTESQWLGVYQGIDENDKLTVAEGEWFTLSVWAYALDLSTFDSGASLELRFVDADGNRIETKQTSIVPTAIDDWQRFVVTMQAPASAVSVFAFAYVTKNGTLYVTDMMLERGVTASDWVISPYDTDYLAEALKGNTTIDGGLILSTQMRLGQTDGDGNYEITAGMSGVVSQEDKSDLAYWSGGDMVDAAVDSVNGATFAIRHNGTAYAAGNTVRFERDRMSVGQNVQLNKDGLSLTDDDGIEKLRVANKSVGTDIPTSHTILAFNADSGTAKFALNKWIINYHYRVPSAGTIITGSYERYYPATRATRMTSLNTASDIQAGDRVSGKIVITVPKPSDDISAIINANISVGYEDSNDDDIVVLNLGSYNLSLNDDKYTVEVPFSFDAPVTAQYQVYFEIPIIEPSADSTVTLGFIDSVENTGERYISNATPTITGQASRENAACNTLGNDGLLVFWGTVAIFANKSQLALKAGEAEFRMIDGVIKYKTKTSDGWVTL